MTWRHGGRHYRKEVFRATADEESELQDRVAREYAEIVDAPRTSASPGRSPA